MSIQCGALRQVVTEGRDLSTVLWYHAIPYPCHSITMVMDRAGSQACMQRGMVIQCGVVINRTGRPQPIIPYRHARNTEQCSERAKKDAEEVLRQLNMHDMVWYGRGL